MKKTFGILLVLVLVGLTGCGDKKKAEVDQVAQAARQSFDKAPEALKASYQAATLAIQSNELAKAKASLDQLAQAKLSPEQQSAVEEMKRELMVKLALAAQGGDATAGKLMMEMRGQSRSR